MNSTYLANLANVRESGKSQEELKLGLLEEVMGRISDFIEKHRADHILSDDDLKVLRKRVYAITREFFTAEKPRWSADTCINFLEELKDDFCYALLKEKNVYRGDDYDVVPILYLTHQTGKQYLE